ncbi:MAG TPA: putative cytokinetic ring protein SteA [Gaiellaceae bacterium]|nr:putative cytokinetic ring protein SteA [Gaiellaceae bacterium]
MAVVSVNGEITGRARLGRRTKELVKRLRPGDVAVIDHADLDRVSAEELMETGVRAVVNVASSTTGRFPNPGPLELVRGGVRLVDAPGASLFDELHDGELVTLRGGAVWRNGTCLATGTALGEPELEEALTQQRRRVGAAIESFADNTLRHLRDEASVLVEGIELPPLTTRFRDRHALVVARGPGHKRDLRIVRPYVRDFRPVLVAVDGGADALLEVGLRPHVIVGDFDSVSDAALRTKAELVVHAYPDGRAPGAERLRGAGLEFQTVSAPGISEDLALLLAHEKGAELIVAVGTHFNLVEFLERDRAGMASTFVTRLRVGEALVDAKGVSRLVSRRVGIWPFVAFAVAGIGAIVVAIAVSPALRNVIEALTRNIADALGL